MATRRTIDDTRMELLDAGASLLLERGISIELENVSMIDVCRDAGLSTTGSAYRIWNNQDAFRADVLRHLLHFTTPDRASEQSVAPMAAKAAKTAQDPVEFVRHAGNATLKRWLGDDEARLIYVTLLLASLQDVELHSALHDHDVEELGFHARLYEAIADTFDREWCPPFDATFMAVTLSALIEGLAFRADSVRDQVEATVSRPTGPNGEMRPWSLFACALDALIDWFTRPRSDAEPGDRATARAELIAAVARSEASDSARHVDDEEPGTAGRSRRRQPLSRTRTTLLNTAARRLIGSGMEVSVGVVDLVDVCEAAGLGSTGSAYRIWETKGAYRVDLVRHLLEGMTNDDVVASDVHAALSEPVSVGIDETIRTAALADLHANAANRAFATSLALWVAGHHDPVVAEQFTVHEEQAIEAFVDLYEFATPMFGRVWKAPFTSNHLAVVLSALVQGMVIRQHVTPEWVPTDLSRPTGPRGEMRPWHLAACAVEAIIDAFTEPAQQSPG